MNELLKLSRLIPLILPVHKSDQACRDDCDAASRGHTILYLATATTNAIIIIAAAKSNGAVAISNGGDGGGRGGRRP